MKDNFALLVTALIAALLSWAAFVYLQEYAFTIMLLIVFASVLTRVLAKKPSCKRNSGNGGSNTHKK